MNTTPLIGERSLMRIHINETDRADGKPLYQAIVERLRARGLAGATVTQCIMGYGATRRLHSIASDVGATDLPVVIECAEDEAKIQAVLPELDAMIGGGLITLERAEVRVYRPAPRRADDGGAN